MSRIYMLDTNAVSDLLNRKSEQLRWTLDSEARGGIIGISTIVTAEVGFGLRKRGSEKLMRAFQEVCAASTVFAWDDACAAAYSDLRLRINKRGIALDTMDLLIASHAYALAATLVTRDSDFRHVAGEVHIVNWATDLK